MTPEQRSRWGERYGITANDVSQLRRLINKYARQQEHVCNGDRHPSLSELADKSRHSEAWHRESEATATILAKLAGDLGFDGVDFRVGLYPCLIKGREECIMVPE